MVRDVNLVRELLLLIEQNDSGDVLKLPDHISISDAASHLVLIEQAGYIKNKILYGDNKPYVIFSELTWNGHELLDSIKNDSVWNKSKVFLKEKGLTAGLEVLKSIAINYTKELV